MQLLADLECTVIQQGLRTKNASRWIWDNAGKIRAYDLRLVKLQIRNVFLACSSDKELIKYSLHVNVAAAGEKNHTW